MRLRKLVVVTLIAALAIMVLAGAVWAGGIHVVKAEYGAGGVWWDCTTKLQKRCDGTDSCLIKASNDIVGDPAPGRVKDLVVTFECPDGRTIRVRGQEGSYLNLNCAPPAGQVAGLHIIQASYGAGGRGFDVTRQVAALCEGNQSCSVQASNRLAGDPFPGRSKTLTVTYQCGSGGRRTVEIEENQWLNLNCAPPPPLPGGGLTIVWAKYGTGDVWRDALNALRTKCQGQQSCSVLASNDLVGDPAPGRAKELVVGYHCGDGRIRQARTAENQWLDLNCALRDTAPFSENQDSGWTGGQDQPPISGDQDSGGWTGGQDSGWSGGGQSTQWPANND